MGYSRNPQRLSINYNVESESNIHNLLAKHSYAENPKIAKHDLEAINLFNQNIRKGEYSGKIKLVRFTRRAYELAPESVVLREVVV